ncbi:hypothetical protein PHJA_002508800 [Phtheirospermum japonicum]|uniref:RAB6-interacting golgin n=1 Tax=Phtheirospermum japonicum TaxID=374723 RepID=A0A830CXA0_9LAMI|nr:hypothetical protein PHJA_002508800 [Phtheirospermum japonicum]
MQTGQISRSLSFNGTLTKEDGEMSKSALSTFRAKEEDIEKKKMEVKEKVQSQLGRIDEETKRLATICEVFALFPFLDVFSCFFFQVILWIFFFGKKCKGLVLASVCACVCVCVCVFACFFCFLLVKV